jgi:protease-4
MEQINRNRTAVVLAIFSFIVIAAIAVVFMWEPDSPVTVKKKGTIGVIEIQGVIEDTEYAGILSAAVHEAMEDNSVKVVVLEIDSPGGTAYLIEQVYLDLLELKEKKPIVASASMALSGGYYLAVTAEEIYAQPTSMVGNVGVIGVGPGFLVPSEFTFESGPQKITGFSPALFPFNITKALDSFASSVEKSRGNRLNLDISELKKGGVYLGGEAVNQGLVDEIGSRQSAISYAAELAELEIYTVDSLVARVANKTVTINLEYPSINELNEANPPPALYYLYMPKDMVMEDIGDEPEGNVTEEVETVGQVVVDKSHGNKVSTYVLDYLSAELSKRGVFVGYSSDWSKVKAALGNATCLFIVAPTQSYTFEEYTVIKDFVEGGGMLVFLSDASVEFLDTSVMQGAINSLANHWGLHFGKGYLYNMVNYHGFYRNVKVTQFEETFLTEELNELVFFTSTYLSSTDADAAFASYSTYNSVSEQTRIYATISVIDRGNSTIIAFGDITWLMEPWIFTADNQRLAMNLIEAIVELNK